MKKWIRMLSAALFMTVFSGLQTLAENTINAEVQQKSHAVKGIVKDALGPMAGVNVMVKGTTNGVMTDVDGKYELKDVNVGSVIEFSFVGYKTVEINVGTGELINVTLEEDQNLLEELVVIGYGTVKKSDVTGSVASVGAEDLGKSSTGDPTLSRPSRAAPPECRL